MSTSGQNYHHGALPTALVQAALDLLGEAGADAVSLRAVARRAGVSAMAPYRHFPDKDALLAEVAAQGFAGLRDVLDAADAAAGPGQALVAQAVAYVGYALANPALFRLMFGPRRGADHPELWRAGGSAYAVLAERVAAQTPPDADREARVLGCWSLVHGLAMLCLEGRIGDATAATSGEIAGRVAAAMLGAAAVAPHGA